MQYRNNNKKNNHFEENFEDSSANFSQIEPFGRESQNFEGQAIQLVQIKSNGMLQVNNEALDIIASYNDKPVGFVTFVGKYRTGKSFLLNTLLFLDNKGFKVQEYTKACTQGIWMWTNPFINDILGNYLFFIDTEGLGSLEKGEENDIKIFTLATLLSSYLIYNSVGCIDSRSISDLSAITKLSKSILAEEGLSLQQNQRRLKDFMPNFCWVLRDFALQLRDYQGRPITSNQYLQNCLKDETSSYSRYDNSQKIKNFITGLFKNRDCVTLVRPATEQHEIQSLKKLPTAYLRKEFLEGVDVLRQKIQRKAGCKMHEGKQLNGLDLACMVQTYVQAINNGKIPTIKTAWEQVVENECEVAFSAAHQKYLQIFEQNFADDQPKEQKQLYKLLSMMKDEAIDEFKKNSSSDSESQMKTLRAWISKQEQSIREANENAMNSKNLQILKDESHNLMKRVQQNYYAGKKQEYLADLETVYKNYRRKAVGDKKDALLVDFRVATDKIGVNLQKKPSSYEDNQHLVKLAQQQMKIQEEANKSKANQAAIAQTIAKNQENNKKKQNEMKNKNSQKLQKAGCCGKCQIM